MRGSPITWEILTRHTSVALVRHEEVTHLVSILQQHIHTVVVPQELTQSVSERVDIVLSLVNPMTCIKQ
jgi:hypothetical protein